MKIKPVRTVLSELFIVQFQYSGIFDKCMCWLISLCADVSTTMRFAFNFCHLNFCYFGTVDQAICKQQHPMVWNSKLWIPSDIQWKFQWFDNLSKNSIKISNRIYHTTLYRNWRRRHNVGCNGSLWKQN